MAKVGYEPLGVLVFQNRRMPTGQGELPWLVWETQRTASAAVVFLLLLLLTTGVPFSKKKERVI